MIINNTRALAHIEVIHDIQPIANADHIELVHVLGWQCIAKRGEFHIGDRCVYIEIDSQLPAEPRYGFLANRGYKIKTIKMRGVLSQGIALPLNIYPELHNAQIGENVTKPLRITKIITAEEKRLLAEEQTSRNAAISRAKARHPRFFKTKLCRWCMRHEHLGNLVLMLLEQRFAKPRAFPVWITKTDEERIQNLPELIGNAMIFVATEKIDGTSTTFGVKARNAKKRNKYEFVVCSRNVRQANEAQENLNAKTTNVNVYWEMAHKYDIEVALNKIARKYNAETVTLQGETIGMGLQGNPYHLLGRDFYGYNLVINGKRLGSIEARAIVAAYGIKWVPILDTEWHMMNSVEDILNYAEGNSVMPTDDGAIVEREGIVFRTPDGQACSFKAVANSFLMRKHPDVLARDIAKKQESKE